jgi:hypothetical protein
LGVAAIFSIRFIFSLPFSNFTRDGNYESVTTLFSFLIYSREKFSFPIGTIRGLTAPFYDANIGNVGAIPLFAIVTKALGKVFPYFETFDYFVLIDITSCFGTAYVVQVILGKLGVSSRSYQALGALLAGTSFLILQRSAGAQPFCTAGVAIFAVFLLVAILVLQGETLSKRHYFAAAILFPIAVLVDTYTFVGLVLATGTLILREFYEAILGGLRASWIRFYRLSAGLTVGISLSVFALYLIGMYPIAAPRTYVGRGFTSYDLGMGGRHHVADVLSPFIPYGHGSLFDVVGIPFTTKDLQPGQYEGIAYVGAAVISIIIITFLLRVLKMSTSKALGRGRYGVGWGARLRLYSPWGKIGLASVVVFIFSLGYELTILGHSFPNFVGMPAAWLADRFPTLYHFRVPGRWASMFSLFLIICSVQMLFVECKEEGRKKYPSGHSWLPRLGKFIIVLAAVIHVVDIGPLLSPERAQSKEPFGGVYSYDQISVLNKLGQNHDVVFIAPGVRSIDVGAKWVIQSFNTAYYLGIKSNLYYIARPKPDHQVRIERDLARVMTGNWDELIQIYGTNKVLIALPVTHVAKFRSKVDQKYTEVTVGSMSFWTRKSQ